MHTYILKPTELGEVGGVILLDTPQQVEAVIACKLAHSVFNINFPRKPEAFLLFIQKVI